MNRISLTVLALSLVLVLQPMAAGHEERETAFPDGTGEVPTYRATAEHEIVVCKPGESLDRIENRVNDTAVKSRALALYDDCVAGLQSGDGTGFEHIQAAVDAVSHTGTNIYVLPAVYHEEPSLVASTDPHCQDHQGEDLLSYETQVACPHLHNLIGIFGDDPADDGRVCGDSPGEVLCDLQIEGIGDDPEDVLVDAAFHKLNAFRADRADGFYLRNLAVQKTEFNSVYVLETDGFVLEQTVTRFNWEYGILTFAVDHGLIRDCEAYGNGDSGVYPGSASDLHGARFAIEITGCDSHHNLLGYSGTAGNSVYAHDNKFHHNSAGVAMDSVFPDHPGLPQDSAVFRHNEIFANNINYYDNFLGEDPICDKPPSEWDWSDNGTVCPVAPVPVGTGILTAGGNDNLFGENWIYDNWRYGTMLFSVPAIVREETDPTAQLDTSHFNKYVGNWMGITPEGDIDPNGIDFWWDEGGTGNCWQDNRHAPTDGLQSNPPAPLLPDCENSPPDTYRPPNLVKLASIVGCAAYDDEDNHHPSGCPWMESPAKPEESDDPVSDLLR